MTALIEYYIEKGFTEFEAQRIVYEIINGDDFDREREESEWK